MQRLQEYHTLALRLLEVFLSVKWILYDRWRMEEVVPAAHQF